MQNQDVYIPSNFTPEECLKVYGFVPEDRLEKVLNEWDPDLLDGVAAQVREAKGCFFPEDGLSELKDRLFQLRKNLRGNNKKTLGSIMSYVEELEIELFNQGDYGRSELKDALNDIGG